MCVMAASGTYILLSLALQLVLTLADSHDVTQQAAANTTHGPTESPQPCQIPDSAIIVSPVNGARDDSCWDGGSDQPCSSVSHSIKGGKETNKSVVLLPGSYRVSGHCVCDFACKYTWFEEKNGTCECGSDVDHVVKCDKESRSVSLLSCYCMTYNNKTRVTVVGACLYSCLDTLSFTDQDSTYRNVPKNPEKINEEMCGRYNRTGQLCAECIDQHSIPAYSYELACVKCQYHHYNWVLYILAAFGPLTVFCVIIFIFRINLASPPFTAFVQLCQGLASPNMVRVLHATSYVPRFSKTRWLIKSLLTVYGIWNLDFLRLVFPDICLPLNQLQLVAIDYLIGFYPLVLVAITYLLIVAHDRNFKIVVWVKKPFRVCLSLFNLSSQDLKSSSVNAFASFILLSYVKLGSVSCDLLLASRVYDMNGTNQWYLYNMGTIRYFSEEHLPYAILAIAITLVFVMLPLFFLFLYPCRWFQRLLGYCHLHSHTVRMLTDAFQGGFTDGTNGTRNCRPFSAAYLMFRVAILVIYSLTKSILFWPLCSLLLLVFALLVVVLRPYKHPLYNRADSVLILMIAMFTISVLSLNVSSVLAPSMVDFFLCIMFLFSLSPLLWTAVMFLYWALVVKQYHKHAFGCMKRYWLVHKERGRHSDRITTNNSIALTPCAVSTNSDILEPLIKEEKD